MYIKRSVSAFEKSANCFLRLGKNKDYLTLEVLRKRDKKLLDHFLRKVFFFIYHNHSHKPKRVLPGNQAGDESHY